MKIVNFVHDEINIEAPEDLMTEAGDVLTSCMAEAGEPFCEIIPLKATIDIGNYWIH